MKKFISQYLIFSVITLIFLVGSNIFLWNYLDGTTNGSELSDFEDVELILKNRDFIEQDKAQQFNCLFFGTSRIYRHINPVLFDSLTHGLTKSYNLGSANLYPFRLLDFIEKITQNQSNDVSLVFIELAPIADIGKNFNAAPIKNAISWDRIQIASDFYSRYEKNYRAQMVATFRYEQSWISRSFYPGLLQQFIFSHYDIDLSESYDLHGFRPLDDETNTEYTDRKETLNDFEFTSFINPISLKTNGVKPGDLYFEQLTDLFQVLKNKGIKVILVIPPRIGDYAQFVADYTYTLQQKEFLVLNLSQPDAFPELYEKKYSFDRAHLNRNGATFMTKYLAKLYMDSLSDH